ncbi:MAG: Flp family type IVb pilin [Dermatophilaceae bacterium]
MTKALVTLQTRIASLRDEKGATAVEYGLMVALIAAAIIVTVTLLGGALDDLFTSVTDDIDPAA